MSKPLTTSVVVKLLGVLAGVLYWSAIAFILYTATR